MIGEYICEYLKPSCEFCKCTCRSDKGCCYHKNVKFRLPCLECDKGTLSKSRRCLDYIRGYYTVIHYQKYHKKK